MQFNNKSNILIFEYKGARLQKYYWHLFGNEYAV